jgi:hypothetical protein
MTRKYIYDDSLEIHFEAKVYYDKERNFFTFSAYILYQQNDLHLCINLSEQEDIAKEKLKSAFLTPIKRKDIKITNAFICDDCVELEKPDEDIRFTYGERQNGKKLVSMPLKQIKFRYKEKVTNAVYRLSSICSPKLFSPIEFLVNNENTVVGIRSSILKEKCFTIPFTLFKKGTHAYIETGKIDDLLNVLSFYYSTRIEYDLVSYPVQEGIGCIEIHVPQYKVVPGSFSQSIGYLLSGRICIGNFIDFLAASNNCDENILNDSLLKSYISGYVRAEYLDDISKLTIYTTILERMAGVRVNDDTYSYIKFYLAQRKINIAKIDDNISKSQIKNEEGDIISHFVQLRNFFIHHLGSDDAELFLRNSDMLFNLKLCITILLLYLLGFPNISFIPDFKHLSLFDDCLKAGKIKIIKSQKSKLCRWVKRIMNNVKQQFIKRNM